MNSMRYGINFDGRPAIDLFIAIPDCKECQERILKILKDEIFEEVLFGYHKGELGQPVKIIPVPVNPEFDLWGHAEKKVEKLRNAGFRVL